MALFALRKEKAGALMQKKTYIEMEYHELDELIQRTFGHRYEVVAFEEWNNDSSHSWTFKVEKLSEYDQKTLDEFIISGKIKNWRTYVLVQHMVNTGVLEPGNYLIEISW